MEHSQMRRSGRRPGPRVRFLAAGALLSLGLAGFAAACGGDGDAGPPATISMGEQLARQNGCAGCHGGNFGGASGPSWVGLAGSQIQLDDGTVVVADATYLTRAITDPGAERRDGYSLKMPANDLSDAEVADIVAYIQSLANG